MDRQAEHALPDPDRLAEEAARWGVETDYVDALGQHRVVDPQALAMVLDALANGCAPPPPDDATRALAPCRAYQGDARLPARAWALAVQLYAIRSRRNIGHGDFTDLLGLIDVAAAFGAAGIGLNPLHAGFADLAEEASPYFPSSRLFLNPLYIDVEAIPECPSLSAVATEAELEALHRADIVDYAGVARIKLRALELAFEAFRRDASRERRHAFEDFLNQRGPTLSHFVAFEVLRRRFQKPWWEWPPPFQTPDDSALAEIRAAEPERIAYHAFLQWLADQQLCACRDRATMLGLPIGLYLDIAVGVRADGFDAWNDQDVILTSLEVGAPPDLLNRDGQRWGLAGVNPLQLAARGFEPFRAVLQASMRYAGAVRLDHVLGLKRLYLIPRSLPSDSGTYVRFPFAALLSVISEESARHRCIVIGEDLGNVPVGFRDTLADWGLWSYQVMLFARADDGGFVAPEHYCHEAVVAFSTHDLPTFRGWTSGDDLHLKRALGLDPGESDEERTAAKDAIGRTLAARGLATVDFRSVAQFLAATPARLLVVAIEDVLGLADQINVPGTVTEYPNWRRRLPVLLEELPQHEDLHAIADTLAAAGRGVGR